MNVSLANGPGQHQSKLDQAGQSGKVWGREVRTCMSSAAQALPDSGDFALDLYELLTTAGLSTACSSKLKEPRLASFHAKHSRGSTC